MTISNNNTNNNALSGFRAIRGNEMKERFMEMGAPNPLVHPFVYEGELTILFADTNVGKSVVAVQLAEMIARKGYRVAYFDLELSDRQFFCRYSREESRELYEFSPNFTRLSPCAETADESGMGDDWMYNAIVRYCEMNRDTRVVFIDNITYLCMACESGNDAGVMMKKLVNLRNTLNLTLVIVAHTPKRDLNDPMTENSLAGSKRIANFADSIVAMGRSSKGDDIRYLKQVKCRSCQMVYGGRSVVSGRLTKREGFLSLQLEEVSPEGDHLQFDKSARGSMDEAIRMKLKEGKSIRRVADEVGCSPSKVHYVSKKAPAATKDAVAVEKPATIKPTAPATYPDITKMTFKPVGKPMPIPVTGPLRRPRPLSDALARREEGGFFPETIAADEAMVPQLAGM